MKRETIRLQPGDEMTVNANNKQIIVQCVEKQPTPEEPTLLTREEVEALGPPIACDDPLHQERFARLKATALDAIQRAEMFESASEKALADRDRHKRQSDRHKHQSDVFERELREMAKHRDRYSKALDRIEQVMPHGQVGREWSILNAISQILTDAGKR